MPAQNSQIGSLESHVERHHSEKREAAETVQEGADESNGSSVGEPLGAKDRVTVPGEVDRAVEQSRSDSNF